MSDANPHKFNQYFKFEPWQVDAATVKELDGLSDLVVIVERKNKGAAGNGAFIIFGLETGLYKTTDAFRLNSDSGKLHNHQGSLGSFDCIMSVSEILSYSVDEILQSHQLTMALLRAYSKLYLNGRPPRGCSKSIRGYYT